MAILRLWQCVKKYNFENLDALYAVVVDGVRTSLDQASGAGHTRHLHDFYFHAFHPSKHYTFQVLLSKLKFFFVTMNVVNFKRLLLFYCCMNFFNLDHF